MKLATATKAEPLTNKSLKAISYGLGLWTAGIAVAQMISFEAFIDALRSYHFAGERGTLIFAIVLLAIEIYSVPFLFRLTLSPVARSVSAILACISPYVWTAMTIMAFVGNRSVQNVGYFGGLVDIPIGTGMAVTLNLVWMTLVTISFGALGGWKALKAIRGDRKTL